MVIPVFPAAAVWLPSNLQALPGHAGLETFRHYALMVDEDLPRSALVEVRKPTAVPPPVKNLMNGSGKG